MSVCGMLGWTRVTFSVRARGGLCRIWRKPRLKASAMTRVGRKISAIHKDLGAGPWRIASPADKSESENHTTGTKRRRLL